MSSSINIETMKSNILNRKIAEAKETLENAKAEVVRAAMAGYSAKDLARRVGELAEAEGRAQALGMLERLITEGKSEAFMPWATEQLLRGADDQWSGRSNDVMRSQFDGFRDGIKSVSGYLAE